MIDSIDDWEDWELRPVLFILGRIIGGHVKYGPGRKPKEYWAKEMAEEAADFVNYWNWWLEEKENG